jgi:medium-chain acyl-[acyl-carrier-protein] hydrolase
MGGDLLQLERRLMASWLVQPSAKPAAAIRLFCVPFAGVGPSAFRGWSQNLPLTIDAIYVHLPGRESRVREASLTDVLRVAHEAANAIAPFTDQPFALFGHSLGALIAFEVARSLRCAGLPAPVRLFVSASRAPQMPSPFPALHGLEDSALLRHVNERYNGSVPQEVFEDDELRELVVPALRADFEALETYRHVVQAPLMCPISAFGGTNDSTLGRAALEAWAAQTSGDFRLRFVDGGHFYLQSARRQLIADICDALALDTPQLVSGH